MSEEEIQAEVMRRFPYDSEEKHCRMKRDWANNARQNYRIELAKGAQPYSFRDKLIGNDSAAARRILG